MFRNSTVLLLVALWAFLQVLSGQTKSSSTATALNAGQCVVMVEVTNSNGSPISGASVSVRGKSDSPSSRFQLFENTDAKGHVRFASLPAGQMLLSIEANGKSFSRKFTTSGTCNFTKVEILIPD